MIIFISIISFLLDGIVSHFISNNSLFLPLFTIISLVLIYPYFKGNDFRYLKYSAILGLLYDITYANTIFFNFFIFIMLGFVIVCLFYFLSNNWYINFFISIIIIVVYRSINYLFLITFKDLEANFSFYIKGIYSSLILNIIYCLILYFITYYYRKKHKIVTK